MECTTSTFARRYEADPESVGRARTELTCFASRAGASDTLLNGLRLAISEAVTNAVRHAYPVEPGEIRVSALLGEHALEVVVSDDGCGVHGSGSGDGGLGFGLALICELSDEMTLAPRSAGGTDLRMRFSLPEPGSAGAVGRL